MDVMNRRAAFVIASLERRRAAYDRELKEAIAAERWSHVAGLHGIGTGLMIAETLLRDEFKRKRR